MDSLSTRPPLSINTPLQPSLAGYSPAPLVSSEKPSWSEDAKLLSERDVVPVLCGPEKKSFMQWAQNCYVEVLASQQVPDREALVSQIEEAYRHHSPQPEVSPMSKPQAIEIMDEMVSQAQKHGLLDRTTGFDSISDFKASLSDSNEQVPDKQLRIAQPGWTTKDKMSRLTLNVYPDKIPEVIHVLTELMADSDWKSTIKSLKVQKLRRLDSLTDTIIVYLAFDRAAADELIQLLERSFPEGATIEHTPFGMERRSKGISYSESVMTETDDGSHGYSRARLIASAIEKCQKNPGLDFQRELENQLFMAGYSPDNPARVADMPKQLQDLTWFLRKVYPRHSTDNKAGLCQVFFLHSLSRPDVPEAQMEAYDQALGELQQSVDQEVNRMVYMSPDNVEMLKAVRVYPSPPVPVQSCDSIYQLSVCLAPDSIHLGPEVLNKVLDRLKRRGIAACYELYSARFVKIYGCTAHLFIPAPLSGVLCVAREMQEELGDALMQGSDLPMRKKIANGLFYGEIFDYDDSFSASRGRAMYAAVVKAETEGYLAERLEECFREEGIDPQFPERLLW